MGKITNNRKRISQDEYYKEISPEKTELADSSQAIAKSLEIALDIRKLELDLYWKRATYFWTLIGAAFVAYFAILGNDKIQANTVYLFLVTCIGFVLTTAWFLANRGSKYWLENWENHVELLESKTIGNLYQIILERSEDPTRIDKLLTSPMPISVSKINQWVGLFMIFIWIVLGIQSLHPTVMNIGNVIASCGAGVGSVVMTYLIIKYSDSYQENQNYKAFKRSSRIVDPPRDSESST